MSDGKNVTLFEHFRSLPDPRVERTRLHSLHDILVITICAMICGSDAWTDIAEFGEEREEWFRRFLKLPNGIPSHDTFGRVFAALDPVAFGVCFASWLAAVSKELVGKVIAAVRCLPGEGADRSGALNPCRAAFRPRPTMAEHVSAASGARARPPRSRLAPACPIGAARRPAGDGIGGSPPAGVEPSDGEPPAGRTRDHFGRAGGLISSVGATLVAPTEAWRSVTVQKTQSP